VPLKGVGVEVLYPNAPAPTAFALVVVGAGVWRLPDPSREAAGRIYWRPILDVRKP
jgi:uncharacterized protein with HEPN domain